MRMGLSYVNEGMNDLLWSACHQKSDRIGQLGSSRSKALEDMSGKSKLAYMKRHEEINTYQSVTFSGGKHGSVIMDKLMSE
jgi:hypothetical protein